MAVTAEPAERLLQDWERPPEDEIYGRSLSAVRRLGAFMVGKQKPEVILSPHAAQAKVEFNTSVEEGFGTDMELGGGLEVRDFDQRSVINGRVMAKDLETPVSSLTESGLKCAKEKYAKEARNGDFRFFPQLRRTEWDHNNAVEVDKMARGETEYNTRIIVSPFPLEAAQESGDRYWRNIGYVPHLKRGFVQLYFASSEGVLSGSLSFDGTNLERLRGVFSKHGIEVPADERTDDWLQHALTDNLTEEQAKALAISLANELGDPQFKKNTNTVDVTKNYEKLVDRVFEDSYVHICESLHLGYQTETTIQLIHHYANQAHHFNDTYTTALYNMRADIDKFTDSDAIVMHELLVYSTIEMMRALHLERITIEGNQQQTNYAYDLSNMNTTQFHNMLGGYGADGARNGRVYSACGLEIAAGRGNEEANPQKAFGDVDRENQSKNSEDTVECEYSGTFCYCCPYDTEGAPLPQPIEITARRGKDGVAKCLRTGCGATLDKNGRGSKGRIYEKAMRRQFNKKAELVAA